MLLHSKERRNSLALRCVTSHWLRSVCTSATSRPTRASVALTECTREQPVVRNLRTGRFGVWDCSPGWEFCAGVCLSVQLPSSRATARDLSSEARATRLATSHAMGQAWTWRVMSATVAVTRAISAMTRRGANASRANRADQARGNQSPSEVPCNATPEAPSMTARRHRAYSRCSSH